MFIRVRQWRGNSAVDEWSFIAMHSLGLTVKVALNRHHCHTHYHLASIALTALL
jgi:hypothetical protein